MDPVSVAATSVSLAEGIARTSIAVTGFASDVSASADDLHQISIELKALSTVLDSITSVLSPSRQNSLPSLLIQEIDSTLHGCLLAVTQTGENVQKYRNDETWTQEKWAMLGQGDMRKLRESLEFYKLALSIGLHAITSHAAEDINKDTDLTQTSIEEVMLRADQILASVNSSRRTDLRSRKDTAIDQWIEDVSILRSYGESTYMEVVADPTELALRQQSRDAPSGDIEERSRKPTSVKPIELCLDGIEEMSDEIQAITLLAKPDGDLIERSATQRLLLPVTQREILDQVLAEIHEATTGEVIRNTIAQGGNPNSDEGGRIISLALRMALDQRNIECVCALLQGGAHPNARVEKGLFGHLALPYAVLKGFEAGVWALVAAGASVNAPKPALNPRWSAGWFFNNTPLICAINLLSQAPDTQFEDSRVRILRFLLANGADVSCRGRDDLRNPFHIVRALSILASGSLALDKPIVLRVARLLLSGENLKGCPPMPSRHECANPFSEAAASGNEQLLMLLGTRLRPYCNMEYWSRAMSSAARARAWECVEVLMKPPYACKQTLHYLIDDYMDPNEKEWFEKPTSPLDWDGFSTAAKMIMAKGANPSTPCFFTYKGQNLLSSDADERDLVSAFQLVKRIATTADRKAVRDLLSRGSIAAKAKATEESTSASDSKKQTSDAATKESRFGVLRSGLARLKSTCKVQEDRKG
ncbi:hypothetical protein QQX98_002080 [Neonectria punicea]|uniref:Azaphilone pigments biosynthesis cluster protein L N-terminal domain-containing protein n=1 Tax=Neonectria punicea TaxID=979145 RepID=A0ABR1HK75_9HYPO